MEWDGLEGSGGGGAGHAASFEEPSASAVPKRQRRPSVRLGEIGDQPAAIIAAEAYWRRLTLWKSKHEHTVVVADSSPPCNGNSNGNSNGGGGYREHISGSDVDELAGASSQPLAARRTPPSLLKRVDNKPSSSGRCPPPPPLSKKNHSSSFASKRIRNSKRELRQRRRRVLRPSLPPPPMRETDNLACLETPHDQNFSAQVRNNRHPHPHPGRFRFGRSPLTEVFATAPSSEEKAENGGREEEEEEEEEEEGGSAERQSLEHETDNAGPVSSAKTRPIIQIQEMDGNAADVQLETIQSKLKCHSSPTTIADGVQGWLHGLGLEKYFPVFDAHEVDVDALPLLTLDDLKEMGINAVGTRRKMFFAIQQLAKALLISGESY